MKTSKADAGARGDIDTTCCDGAEGLRAVRCAGFRPPVRHRNFPTAARRDDAQAALIRGNGCSMKPGEHGRNQQGQDLPVGHLLNKRKARVMSGPESRPRPVKLRVNESTPEAACPSGARTPAVASGGLDAPRTSGVMRSGERGRARMDHRDVTAGRDRNFYSAKQDGWV